MTMTTHGRFTPRPVRALAAAALGLTIGLTGCGFSAGVGSARSSDPVPGHPGRAAGRRSDPPGQSRQSPESGPIGAGYLTKLHPDSAWLDRHIWLAEYEPQPLDLHDVRVEAQMGLNLLWSLAGTPGDPADEVADFDTIRRGGLHIVAPFADGQTGSETVGFVGEDEPDMDFGAGSDPWQDVGPAGACVPVTAHCGYTSSRFFYDGDRDGVVGAATLPYPVGDRAVVNGYGKGVLFWDPPTQAAAFLRYTDVLLADSYWMTDPDLSAPSQGGCALASASAVACGPGGTGSGLTPAQTALPANYAYDVTRLAQLETRVGPAKPIAVYVETGCPFPDSGRAGRCTTPQAATAAAWHALIAGAHGIVWFSHNFSGPCFDDHTFADGMTPSSPLYTCQQTPGVSLHDLDVDVAAFDHEVASLNAVLLAPTLRHAVRTRGDVSTLAKVLGDRCWVIAGAGQPGRPPAPGAEVAFRLASDYSGRIDVVDEGRTVMVRRGRFSDRFANADAVHVYEIRGASACR